MSNPPTNPFSPPPEDKGTWIYSGLNGPAPLDAPAPNIPMPTPNPAPTPAPIPTSLPPLPPLPTTTFTNPFASKKPAGSTKSDDGSLAGIVDTIEAIIIALILALTFRAFIVEAFVIPTGSMAPTLLGAHFNVVCPKCGYVFTRETSLTWQRVGNDLSLMGNRAELTDNRAIPSDQGLSGRSGSEYIYCPNCAFAIDTSQLPQRLPPATIQIPNNGAHKLNFAWTNNGDRILVLKYLYTLTDPHRFDVIVFKEPLQGRENYIKRLIGLPGETIEIINGDIFVGQPGKSDPADLQIARKPAHVQQALWQLVYDNDFYPRDEGDGRGDGTVWNNPWAGAGKTAAAWDNHDAKTVFHYTGDGAGSLKFDGRDPYGFNILGYDNDIPLISSAERGRTLLRATDLRVETVWTPQTAAAASLAMSVGQPSNLYRFQWSSQGLSLSHFNTVTKAYETIATLDAGHAPAIEPGHAYHVALDNVDRTTRVWIDNKVVLEPPETPWSAADALADMPQQQQDSMGDVRPVIGIDVGGPCTLGHLKLFRDLYYTQTPTGNDLANYAHTANANSPLTLGPEEYFALGDNSRDSLDGRMWTSVNPSLDDLGTRRGIVPRRYLLGKAFFVYWPAGYRPDASDSIPSSLNIPLVPNAGDMRLIR